MMTYKEYMEYINNTVVESSTKVKSHFKKILKNNNLLISEPSLFEDNSITSNDRLNHELKESLQKSEKALEQYERWEFIRDYKYSVLFYVDDFDGFLEKILSFSSARSEYQEDSLAESLNIFLDYEGMFFLKFNRFFSAVHPQTSKELLLKYPLIVVFHKKEKLIEFRFDVLKKIFITDTMDTTFYSALIQKQIEYFNCMGIKLKAVDLDFMINEAKKKKELFPVSQYMQLSNGGFAQLEVGNNQEYVMPFIEELKALMLEYKCDLEKVPVLRDILEQFIYEKEELSNYPWIELLLKNNIKTRSIHIKLIFNYMHNEYCLIQHYYNSVLIGMERMNHVTNFIAEHRSAVEEKV